MCKPLQVHYLVINIYHVSQTDIFSVFIFKFQCFVCLFPDGSLYAVGGYDSSSHLATVEKYDPQVQQLKFARALRSIFATSVRL